MGRGSRILDTGHWTLNIGHWNEILSFPPARAQFRSGPWRLRGSLVPWLRSGRTCGDDAMAFPSRAEGGSLPSWLLPYAGSSVKLMRARFLVQLLWCLKLLEAVAGNADDPLQLTPARAAIREPRCDGRPRQHVQWTGSRTSPVSSRLQVASAAVLWWISRRQPGRCNSTGRYL